MKTAALILSGASVVHAASDRQLAAPAGTHYAHSGTINGHTLEDETNVKWAAYDLDKGNGVSPAPHEAFGTYNCRGYYQSPIDVPKKALLKEYRDSGNKNVPTKGYKGTYPIAMADSVYEHYDFGATGAFKAQRDVDPVSNLPKTYVDMIFRDETKNFGLKIGMGATSKANPSAAAPVGLYRPLQFHWHFPSEHTVDGVAYPAELHIVHTRLSHFRNGDFEYATQAGVFTAGTYDAPTTDACSTPANKDTNIVVATGLPANGASDATACNLYSAKHMPFLVLGFFLTDTAGKHPDALGAEPSYEDEPPVGATNTVQDELDPLEAAYAAAELEKLYLDNGDGLYIGSNATDFEYKNTFGSAMKGRYYRYQGGLTTPPCTEGVEWVLFERPLLVQTKFWSHQFGSASRINGHVNGGAGHTAVADPGYTAAGPEAIAVLSKKTPVWSRNNRPTIPIHGRQVSYSQLTSFTNPPEATLAAAGQLMDGSYNSANFNYLKPETMWNKMNCFDTTTGTQCANGNQCENAVTDPINARQAPINIVGAEVYKGVMPVNHAWLAANTAGYVHSSVGTAARWKLMNTGHGFNVIPQFTYTGAGSSHTGGDQSNSAFHTLLGHHRQLAGYGGGPAKGYYVKKINAAATAVEWYPLAQFHFHFPSENTVDGYQYQGEMHMVHVGDGSYVEDLKKNETAAGAPTQRIRQMKDAEGKDSVVIDVTDMEARELAAAPAAAAAPSGQAVTVAGSKAKNMNDAAWLNAVVLGFFLTVDDTKFATANDDSLMSLFGFKKSTGVPFTRGHYWTIDVDEKRFAEVLFGPSVKKTSLTATPEYDLTAPTTRNYFNYMGGLTTPGCNEGVQFIIFTDPLYVRTEEFRLFKQNYWANNRPTQPRGDRIVLFNDMANAQQPLVGANKMSGTNPFAPTEKSSSTTIYAVSSSGGAATNALNMLVGAVISALTLALYM